MNWIGEPRKRVEDLPLITGKGHYISDIGLPRMVHLAVLRSPHAHARIQAVHLDTARSLPGVLGAWAADDLAEIMKPAPVASGDPTIRIVAPTPLAVGVVRYVGEAVAVVAAENRYLAEDALGRITVDYEPLPAVVDPEHDPDSTPILHPDWPSNVAESYHATVGQGAAALRDADVVVEETLIIRRMSGQPMEPRAVVAVWDEAQGRLTFYHATQGVHTARRQLAHVLGLDESQVQVIAPDVGGGFGIKNRLYSEEVLAGHLARTLQRPVKWVGDRRDEFLASNQERDQIHRAKLGLTRSGHIVALVDDFVQDAGAYTVTAGTPTLTTATNVNGPYRIPNLDVSYKMVVTNKVPVGPYRGAGRPQGTHVIERLLDRAAERLGMDRAEIRRQNLIIPNQMPYDTGLVAGAKGPVIFDAGDYPRGMEMVLDAIDYAGFAVRQAEARKHGRYIGLGIANYIEQSGGGGEGARIRCYPDGTVVLGTGASAQGQGHRTALAQILATALDIPFERIRIDEGNSDAIDKGTGTFGSRSIILVGNAANIAAQKVRNQLMESAAKKLEASVGDLEWVFDGIQVRGVPQTRLSFADVVQSALSDTGAPAVEAVEHFSAPMTFGFGAHAAVLEVDPQTAGVRILDYVMGQDSGVIVNPLLANGQIIGAAVQGLGTALWEETHLDESGQPINTTYLDYLLPGAAETPDFRLLHQDFPATTNPAGFKGVGEGGIIPSTAVVASAIENALAPFGVKLDTVPISPERLFEALEAAQQEVRA